MEKTKTTPEQYIAVIKQVQAIAEAIRELKQVPSGHLYARIMQYVSLTEYEKIISILENSKLIRRDPSGLLTWILKPCDINMSNKAEPA